MTPGVRRRTRGGEATSSQGDEAETTPQHTTAKAAIFAEHAYPSAELRSEDAAGAMTGGLPPPTSPSWKPADHLRVRLPQPQKPLRSLSALSQWEEFYLSTARVVKLVYVDHVRVPVIRQWLPSSAS